MSTPPPGEPRPLSWSVFAHALAELSATPTSGLPGALQAITATAERVLTGASVAVSLMDGPGAGRSVADLGEGAAAEILEAPIRGGGVVLGHVRCERPAALGNWSEAERAFVASLATAASLAVERDRRGQLEAQLRERARYEDALRASEEAYRAIFDSSHDGIFVQDPETGAILDANRRVCELHGVTLDDIRARGVTEVGAVVQPFTAELAAEYVARAASGELLRFEWCSLHHGTGERMWVEVGLQRVTLLGEPRILAVVRDIRDRKRAEAEMHASEESYRAIFDASNDAILVHDSRTGAILDVNDRACEMHGFAREEILGRTLEIVGTVPPFTAERAMAHMQRAARGESLRFEWCALDAADDEIWTEVSLQPVTIRGERRILALVRDINDRKAAERRLRQVNEELERRVEERTAALAVANDALSSSEEHFRRLIENSHDITCILAADGVMKYMSPSVERVLGYAPAELEGQLAFDYMHADDVPLVVQELTRVAATSHAVGHAEYRFRHRDGSWRRMEAFARTLAADSADDGLVANIRDVTERRRTEKALRQATADAEAARGEAEAANVAKSEFLSRMSHELRTPMNSILGFAQILRESELTTADRNAVQHILTAGEHLLNLINEVLDISRIEAGRQELSLEPVRLGSVLQEAIALVRPLAAARGVWVAEGLGAAGDCFVRADRQRLAQVLLNLLSNAVKYNQAGGSVRIGSELLVGETLDWGTTGEGSAARVRVRVEDSGRGIAPERQDQLFVPFARLGAEQTGVEGTGLGLALSQRLMTAMGGTLALESSSAQGSVFSVELRAVASPVAAATPLPLCTRPPALHREAGVKIVYVEDNLANLSLIEAVLAPYAGWSLIPALQGQLGVELAREHAPDLVLLDLHLPDIPGEEVLRRLRADPRTASVPVAVISADATAKSIERLRTAGADAYLTKPLDVKLFLRTMERLLAAPVRA